MTSLFQNGNIHSSKHKPAMQHGVNMMMVMQVYDRCVFHLWLLIKDYNPELQSLFSRK